MSVVFVEFSVCVFRLTWCYSMFTSCRHGYPLGVLMAQDTGIGSSNVMTSIKISYINK